MVDGLGIFAERRMLFVGRRRMWGAEG